MRLRVEECTHLPSLCVILGEQLFFFLSSGFRFLSREYSLSENLKLAAHSSTSPHLKKKNDQFSFTAPFSTCQCNRATEIASPLPAERRPVASLRRTRRARLHGNVVLLLYCLRACTPRYCHLPVLPFTLLLTPPGRHTAGVLQCVCKSASAQVIFIAQIRFCFLCVALLSHYF